MRIIDGSDWSPQGTVTAWLPTTAMSQAHQDAEIDPTPPSMLQADHVRGVLAVRARGDRHHAYTCSVATLPGSPDLDRLTFAVNRFISSHEGLRSSLAIDADFSAGSIHRKTVPAKDVDMQPVSVATPIEDFLATTAVFDHFPAMAVLIVARSDGRSFDLLFALDHASGDGISQMTGLLELIARYTGTSVPGLTSDTHPSYLTYVREEISRAAEVDGQSPGVEAWQEFFRITGGVIPSFPLPTGIADDLPQPVVGVEGALANAEVSDHLRGIARKHQVSFSTVVYAALGLAHRHLTGEDHYVTVVVASTRGAQYAFSQGWFCNFTPLYFPVCGATISDILPGVAVAQARMKSMLNEPVHASLGRLVLSGDLDPSMMTSPQMVTYLDLEWFEEPKGADIRLFTGFGTTKNANLWLFRNRNGLGIASQAPNNPTARASLETYFSTIRSFLAADTTQLE